MTESRAIEKIPANELDLLLFTFLISIRKKNGPEYEPGTLSGFQRSFQRTYMKKEVWLTFLRIMSSPSPERYSLLQNERTWWNYPNATRELTEAGEYALFENNQLGVNLQAKNW